MEPLRKKYENSVLEFQFEKVDIQTVRKILKELKKKTSHGWDEISSEILKMGADALAEPLTAIINHSIETSKFPTSWKEAIVCPLYKKGDRKLVNNYRPVSLLPVTGMILEKVVANQIEDYFEKNQLLGKYLISFSLVLYLQYDIFIQKGR